MGRWCLGYFPLSGHHHFVLRRSGETGCAWWCTPGVLALGRERQEDQELLIELETSVGYMKLFLKKNKQTKTKNKNQYP